MTESEFWSILGEEWQTGKGRADWCSFREGKVSKDPSKQSKPARCYIHVMRKDEIMPLNEAVRSKTWEDAKGTHTDPALIGPPQVEFSLYDKIPSTKKRTDTRQGTIDQDPEFMAFLESLANPTQPKDTELDDDETDKDVKVTTTPLVEYLKVKKAAKSKENPNKRQAKNTQEGGKGKGGSKDEDQGKKKGKAAKDDKTKEPVKILTKKAATEQAAEAAKAAAGQINAGNAADAPKSRRAGIAAAARLLQRDLGLSPGSAHRRARQDAAKAEADAKSEVGEAVQKDSATGAATTAAANVNERPASPAPSDNGSQTSKATGGQAPSKTQKRNRGAKSAEKNKASENSASQSAAPSKPTMILKKKSEGEGQSQPPSQGSAETPAGDKVNEPRSAGKGAVNKSNQQKKPAGVSPNATRAFVKHVNASQGVTDETLRESLQSFGAIVSVEVDKRKGFAYVEFSEHDALVRAIAASPVTVGQGSVQVLERKEKKPQNQPAGNAASGESSSKNEKGGRGRRGRGGGNKNAGGDKGHSPTLSAAPVAPDTEAGG